MVSAQQFFWKAKWGCRDVEVSEAARMIGRGWRGGVKWAGVGLYVIDALVVPQMRGRWGLGGGCVCGAG
jgi:hypothetical protein